MGGVIVFVAIITSLLVVYIDPKKATPSLVGLAINYTLLVPIYLNWVVKLLSDMEMYIGAVERISYYIEAENSENGRKENCKFFSSNLCKLFLLFFSVHRQFWFLFFFLLSLLRVTNVILCSCFIHINESYMGSFYHSGNQRY